LKVNHYGIKGFTLLEILIALAIISGALITIIHTVNYHLNLIQRHEIMTVGTILGRDKILEVTEQQRDKKGRFPEPYDDYTFEIEIEDSPFEKVKMIKLYVIKENERIYLSRFIRSGT
jgi:general secretion pathway protein I